LRWRRGSAPPLRRSIVARSGRDPRRAPPSRSTISAATSSAIAGTSCWAIARLLLACRKKIEALRPHRQRLSMAGMELSLTVTGQPGPQPPVLVVHGLFGQARNLGVISRALSETRQVIA